MTNRERATAYRVPCRDLEAATTRLIAELGLRVEVIRPADDPARMELAGSGIHVVLVRDAGADPDLTLRFVERARKTGSVVPPAGVDVVTLDDDLPVGAPTFPPEFVLQRFDEASSWQTGRAGMLYRDLIPGRLGGAVVASHIRIPEAGPVPDYVHYHRVHFQMIYCLAGWVRVVYEDQGPPFVLEPGDCVLQPPGIRHRVLECSAGLEVLELGCPADHETRVEHEFTLPTDVHRPEREFEGQRFLRHRASEGNWQETGRSGWRARDTGMTAATGGLADARVLRLERASGPSQGAHDTVFRFWFLLEGAIRLHIEGREREELARGDAVVIPPGVTFSGTGTAPASEILEIGVLS